MRLGEELAPQPLRPLACGVEEFVDEPLSWPAPALASALDEIAEVYRVAFEIEQREFRGIPVDPLPVAVDEDKARSLVGLHQNALLGHHRDRPFLLSGVMHEDAVERSALTPADVDGDAFGQRVEGAFLQEKRRVIATQDELPLLELPVADRHHVHDDRV